MSFFRRMWGAKDESAEYETAAIFQLAVSERLAQVLRRDEAPPAAFPKTETGPVQADSELRPHVSVADRNDDAGSSMTGPSSAKALPTQAGSSGRGAVETAAVACEEPPAEQVSRDEVTKVLAGLAEASRESPEKTTPWLQAPKPLFDLPAGSSQAALETIRASSDAAVSSIQAAYKDAVEQLRATQRELESAFQNQQSQAVAAACEQVRLSWHSGVDEVKKQSAALVDASRLALAQAGADEHRQRLEQASQQVDEAARKSTETAANSIRLAASQAVTELRAAQESMRAALQTVASDNQKHLAQLASAIAKMRSGLPALLDRRVTEVTEEFRGQIRDAASESLEGKVRAIETAHRETLAKQEEALQKRIDEFLSARLHQRGRVIAQRTQKPQASQLWMGLKLGLGFGLMILIGTAVFLSMRPGLRLRGEPPTGFVEDHPEWTVKKRAREQQLARGYWESAVREVQQRYAFGARLPDEPPPEFQADEKGLLSTNPKLDIATRARYWEKIRELWRAPDSWEQYPHWNVDWLHRALQWVDSKTSQYLAGFG